MKLPIAALLALTHPSATDAATDAATSTTADGTLIDINPDQRRAFHLESISDKLHFNQHQLSTDQQHTNNQQHQQLRLQHTNQRHLQSDICSCSPTVFHIRLDFSKDCSSDTLKQNDGVRGTLCLLGEAPDFIVPTPQPQTPPTPETMPPNTSPPNSQPSLPPVAGISTAPPTASDGLTSNPTLPSVPIVTPPPVPSGGNTPVPPGETSYPTWAPTSPYPTWSPTTLGDDPFLPPRPTPPDGTRTNNNNDTYEPTQPWPTYAPTMTPDDKSGHKRTANNGNNGLSKKDRKDIKQTVRVSGGDVSDVKAAEEAAANGQVVKHTMLERVAGYTSGHAMTHVAWANTNDGGEGIPTYEPTTPWPTYIATPFPTDDETYAPTVNNNVGSNGWGSLDPTSYMPTTEGHARNLEEHVGGEAGDGRRLNSGASVIGQWTSIPLNDDFFTKFPEWRERQSEIYQLRNAQNNHASSSAQSYESTAITRGNNQGGEARRLKRGGLKLRDAHDVETTTTSTTTTGMPNRLISAQFLEMDTSTNMNIINQNDQYINVTFPPNTPSNPITEYTLSYTSISATLDPSLALGDQLELVPGGVILILIGVTEAGEVVRNRVMWTYTMGCAEDDVTVEVGDEFGWTMFDKLQPARQEFCPASPGGTPTASPVAEIPGTKEPTSPGSKEPSMPTTSRPTRKPTTSGSKPTKPTTSSSKASKPHKPSSSSSATSTKAGKPGLSMPSGDLMDHFNLSKSSKSSSSKASSNSSPSSSSSKATKPSSSSNGSSKATKPSSSSGSSNSSSSKSSRRRQLQRDQLEQEETEVFGRRISRHNESRRRTGVIFAEDDNESSAAVVDDGEVQVIKDIHNHAGYGTGGRPIRKRRLRQRSV